MENPDIVDKYIAYSNENKKMEERGYSPIKYFNTGNIFGNCSNNHSNRL